MKIAVYHNQVGGGGAARVVEEWWKHAGKDHEVELFVPSTVDTGGFVDLEQYAAKVHRQPIEQSESPLGRYRRAFGVPKYGREIAADIDAGGFDVVFANLSYVTQAPEILPYLQTPSLYYAPEPLRAVYDRSPFPEPKNPKSVAKKIFFGPYDARRKRFDRAAIKQATQVMTHSQYTRGILKKIYGVDAAVVLLGVDTETFRPTGTAREGFVLSVGGMHPLKGHQFIIEALASLPEPRPKLVLVGGRGDFGRVLEAYAREKDVDLEIRHNVPTTELVELYNRAGVSATAAYGEPFGLTPLEAMACGAPVVTVDEAGYQETVKDGETGLRVPREPQAFGAALQRVLADPQLAATLGQNGRTDVERNWQWSRTATEIQRLLEATAGR